MADVVVAAAGRGAGRRRRPGSCCGPKAVDDAGFTVSQSEGDRLPRRAASKPERWVRQTDFNNDEAVGYLADRLARLGVEDGAARARGAEARATDGRRSVPATGRRVVFDWEPDACAGRRQSCCRDGRRGTDLRGSTDAVRRAAPPAMRSPSARRAPAGSSSRSAPPR